MTLKRLVQAELLAFLSTLLCSLGLFSLGMLKGLLLPDDLFADPFASPLLAAGFSFVFATPFALLYGAPLLAWLTRRQPVAWWLAVIIGAAPLLLFVRSVPYPFILALGFGVATAVCLWAFLPPAGQGPNSSSKPTPLRGAA